MRRLRSTVLVSLGVLALAADASAQPAPEPLVMTIDVNARATVMSTKPARDGDTEVVIDAGSTAGILPGDTLVSTGVSGGPITVKIDTVTAKTSTGFTSSARGAALLNQPVQFLAWGCAPAPGVAPGQILAPGGPPPGYTEVSLTDVSVTPTGAKVTSATRASDLVPGAAVVAFTQSGVRLAGSVSEAWNGQLEGVLTAPTRLPSSVTMSKVYVQRSMCVRKPKTATVGGLLAVERVTSASPATGATRSRIDISGGHAKGIRVGETAQVRLASGSVAPFRISSVEANEASGFIDLSTAAVNGRPVEFERAACGPAITLASINAKPPNGFFDSKPFNSVASNGRILLRTRGHKQAVPGSTVLIEFASPVPPGLPPVMMGTLEQLEIGGGVLIIPATPVANAPKVIPGTIERVRIPLSTPCRHR